MSSDNVDILPIWKKDSTPEEFLSELAMIARKKPEMFSKMVLLYEEFLPEGGSITRYRARGTSILELLGIIESGKHQALVQCTRE